MIARLKMTLGDIADSRGATPFDMAIVSDGTWELSISIAADTDTGFIADALLPRIAPAHLNTMILVDIISFILFEIKLYIVTIPMTKVKKGTGNSLNNKTDTLSTTKIDHIIIHFYAVGKVSDIFLTGKALGWIGG